MECESGVEITVDNCASTPSPNLDGKTITFMLSTNADTLNLVISLTIANAVFGGDLACNPVVTISKANVDENMEIDVGTLSEPDSEYWRRCVIDRIRKDVKIKFLFSPAE